MTKDKIIHWAEFIVIGVVGSIILILISELIKFSHVNLIPLGGYSWALWSYAVFVGISFGVASRIFKIGNSLIIGGILSIICFAILYFLTYGLFFTNPMPFGIGAGPIL